MLTAAAVAASAANRWLLAGTLSAAAVLGLAAYTRAASRRRGPERRGTRRRAGALIALGPLIGLAFAPELGDLTLVVALGALVLAVVGATIERANDADRTTLIVVAIAAAIAVAAGARLGPTGVEALDVLGAFASIFLVMKSSTASATPTASQPGPGSAPARHSSGSPRSRIRTGSPVC